MRSCVFRLAAVLLIAAPPGLWAQPVGRGPVPTGPVAPGALPFGAVGREEALALQRVLSTTDPALRSPLTVKLLALDASVAEERALLAPLLAAEGAPAGEFAGVAERLVEARIIGSIASAKSAQDVQALRAALPELEQLRPLVELYRPERLEEFTAELADARERSLRIQELGRLAERTARELAHGTRGPASERETVSDDEGSGRAAVLRLKPASPQRLFAPRAAGPASPRDFAPAATALRVSGYAMLGAAALSSAAGLAGMAALGLVTQGVLTYSGVVTLGLARFFGRPSAAPADAPPALNAAPGRLERFFGSFTAIWRSAQESARLHRGFEASVGGGSVERARVWLASAGRTILFWVPLALLGMFGGAMLSMVQNAAGGLALSGTLPPEAAAGLAAIPMSEMILGMMAGELLRQLALLGVVLGGTRKLLTRFGVGDGLAEWTGIAAVMALSVGFAVWTATPLAAALPLLGIQAMVALLYARSGSLLAAVGLQTGLTFLSLDSARMLAFLQVPIEGVLISPPVWAGLAVLGLSAVLFAASAAATQWAARGWGFLKAAATLEFGRLKELGAWWSTRLPDGSPHRILPLAAVGLLWAIPTYLSMDLVYQGLHWTLPQAEPAPEILRRLIFMPLDIIVYNFVVVAALEEWVFRKGLFRPIVERIKKFGAPERWWFWPAAILSSIIFSAAHYVDWSGVLAHVGIAPNPILASLAQTYAFTWASFMARVVGGLVLAGLYARSGLLLVPMIAHFGSNMLESIGLRWGLPYFLAGVAAIFVLQWFRGAKIPTK